MDKRLLESKMKLFGDNQHNLALAIGVGAVTFNKKINENNAQFTQSEIAKIKNRYNLTPEEVDRIFFAKNVS